MPLDPASVYSGAIRFAGEAGRANPSLAKAAATAAAAHVRDALAHNAQLRNPKSDATILKGAQQAAAAAWKKGAKEKGKPNKEKEVATSIYIDPRLWHPGPRYTKQPLALGPITPPWQKTFSWGSRAAAAAQVSSKGPIRGSVDVQRQPSQTGKILDLVFDTGWNPSAFDEAFTQLDEAKINANKLDQGTSIDVGAAFPPSYSGSAAQQFATEEAQVLPQALSTVSKESVKKTFPIGWLVVAAVAGLLLARGQRKRFA